MIFGNEMDLIGCRLQSAMYSSIRIVNSRYYSAKVGLAAWLIAQYDSGVGSS